MNSEHFTSIIRLLVENGMSPDKALAIAKRELELTKNKVQHEIEQYAFNLNAQLHDELDRQQYQEGTIPTDLPF